MFNFGFNNVGADIGFKLSNAEGRETIACQRLNSSGTELLPVYSCVEPISGVVHINLHPGKKVEHSGIKLEAIGQVEVLGEKKKEKIKFSFLVKELRAPGTLFQSDTHNFDFNIERVHETFRGKRIHIRYFIRLTISKNYGSSIVKELDIAVRNTPTTGPNPSLIKEGLEDGVVPQQDEGIKMEVGIEDCLHIEFEFNKSRYTLDDVILGTIKFMLVRIKIKYMELGIIQRETVQIGSSNTTDSTNMIKHEVMDGAPIKDEIIPVRLFLKNLNLTPTYRSVGGIASVKYFLNLVLIDEEDRRYFKQHEVIFSRSAPNL